jgi:hypothetical protein
LVLTGYYLKFVLNYDKIATPLIALLEKNGFFWMLEADHSFQDLKYAK